MKQAMCQVLDKTGWIDKAMPLTWKALSVNIINRPTSNDSETPRM